MVKFIPVNYLDKNMLNTRDDISQYWNTILDTIQEGLMVMSPTGRILSINKAAEELTGYKSSELVGQSCTILECTGCNIFGNGAGKDWCELFSIGTVRSKRCRVTAKGRSKVHVVKRGTILKDEDGQIIGAVETLTNITEEVNKEKEIARLRRSLALEDGFHGIVGQSSAIRRIFGLIEDAARSDAAVIITGESGTGKELVARAIHKLSPRHKKPFVKVDCVSMNENVLESELFGHVRGAFTGADRTRTGRFELAREGHVFLDEIGDVPRAIQVKLLRVLEEKVIERVGENHPVDVDVRVITATNRDLSQMIEEGLFREDLFYRINVVPIKLPALRERREDVPLLAQAFADRMAAKTGKPVDGFTPEAMSALYRYNWPGNVRELRNAVEYAFVVCHEGSIELSHLPESIAAASICAEPSPPGDNEVQSTALEPTGVPNKPDGQREELIAALTQAKGNQSQAARILGVSRMTIWKRMKKYGINLSRDIV